ncbi:lethal (2) SH0834 [Musca autumnalis]|uniref:lethal (2) SH0834 n=1 Tax=Musca autumnalis TaxID=221902 RepID=UPI003CE84FCC
MEETISNETVENNENDNEMLAKDKLNQRREARRRKILENAKNRLERLNGRTVAVNDEMPPSTERRQPIKIEYEHTNGPTTTATETAEFSDPEVEPDILPQHMRQFVRDNGGSLPFNSFDLNTATLQDETPTNDLNDLLNMFQTVPTVKERHILVKARIHLIVSALISSVFAIFWPEIGYSIFILPGICVITDLLFFREQKPLHPMLNMIFMLFSNHLPPQAQKCLHIFTIVQSIIVDLGVFIFSFCTLFYLITLCTNNVVTGLMVIK